MTVDLLTLIVFLLCAVVGFMGLVLAATVCKLQETVQMHNKLAGQHNAFVRDLFAGRIMLVIQQLPVAEPHDEPAEWWQKGEQPPWESGE